MSSDALLFVANALDRGYRQTLTDDDIHRLNCILTNIHLTSLIVDKLIHLLTESVGDSYHACKQLNTHFVKLAGTSEIIGCKFLAQLQRHPAVGYKHELGDSISIWLFECLSAELCRYIMALELLPSSLSP